MSLQQNITRFRDRADDRGAPPLWSDATLADFFTEAESEAARRARLIEDRDTASICSIAVTAGTAVYDIDRRVIILRRVKLASMTDALPKSDERDLAREFPAWELFTPQEPRTWIPWGTHQVRLIPTPDTDDTMNLWVVREPLRRQRLAQAALDVTSINWAGDVATVTLDAPDATLSDGDEVLIAGATPTDYNGGHVITVVNSSVFTFPLVGAVTTPATGTITYAVYAVDAEIAPRYERKLVSWAMFRALDQRDKEEKYDAAGAQRHLDEFESEFGKRSSAIDETWIARRHGVDDLEGLY